VIDSAKKVEGIARHSSTHAAGVVISRDPLVEHVPLQRAGGKSEGDVTTQYAQGLLEEIGLLKMDFLGSAR
jgi:DNA polymerase-3 subunit alpha